MNEQDFKELVDTNIIRVLDEHGYVRLVDALGDELRVVNAAKASFEKESKGFGEKEDKLLRFLWEHGHTSPFRHAMLTFEIRAPLMVARQWWKYVVGSDHTMDAWNETCFSGSQVVRANNSQAFTVAELAERSIRGRSMPMLRSVLPDGTIAVNQIKRVWATGTAEVFRVTSRTGNQIMTTGNHRYLTSGGWKELREIRPGESVMMNGIPVWRDRDWLHEQYVQQGRSQKELAAAVPIEKIESLGMLPVFDIEMCGVDNLIVDHFVVHNSRRYVTDNEVFYVPRPNQMRSIPDSKKQGSKEGPPDGADEMEAELLEQVMNGHRLYLKLMDKGLCAEQARLALSAYALHTRWYWTASLQSVMHFLTQRLDEHAQWEIRQYADAVRRLASEKFPLAIGMVAST